jgi:hypothetical protein
MVLQSFELWPSSLWPHFTDIVDVSTAIISKIMGMNEPPLKAIVAFMLLIFPISNFDMGPLLGVIHPQL